FVAQEPPGLPLSVARDFLRLEAVEGAAEILPLAQDGDPRKPRLETVEHELLVKRAMVELRHAPFYVVVGDVERVSARPGTANGLQTHRRRVLRFRVALARFA